MPLYTLYDTNLICNSLTHAIWCYNNLGAYQEDRDHTGIYEPNEDDLELISHEAPVETTTHWQLDPPDFNTSALQAIQGSYGIASIIGASPTNNEDSPTSKNTKEKKIGDPHKTTVSNLYRYHGLSKYQGLGGKTPVRADTTFVGVEVELEKVTIHSMPSGTWKMTEDGSLKIQGMEFVTIPIQFKYLEVELERLFAGISGEPSTRCSIHVHINARDFTITELKNFILLYLIFERGFYNFSGNRRDNNFCIPLSYYPYVVKHFLSQLDKGIFYPKWYKYYGFNLAPLFGGDSSDSIGTIEFRHMKGTKDVAYILNWINLIVSLKISAKKMKTSEILEYINSMNTTSGYYWLAETVFKDYSPLLTKQPTFKTDVEHCITMAKTILLPQYGQQPEQEEEISIIKRR